MKTIGVIAEFNPFHNGHKYLIDEARKYVAETTGEETAVIAVMSGNYVQRGSAAIFDKYTRAASSLISTDIVFEIPVVWATSDAGRFAECGVYMLSELSTDYIAFGIEAGSGGTSLSGSDSGAGDGVVDDGTQAAAAVEKELLSAAEILYDEPAEYKDLLQRYLSIGLPYPAARIKAIQDFTDSDCKSLSTPNNILALEYLISIKKAGSTVKPIFIPRKGAAYSSTEVKENYSSATAIRTLLTSRDNPIIRDLLSASEAPEDILTTGIDIIIKKNMPKFSLDVIKNYTQVPTVSDSDILPYFIGKLKTSSASELSGIYGMTEELLNRMMKTPLPTDYDSLKDYMKTRNNTMTRVCRLILHTALGIIEPEGGFEKPEYINLLAMKKSASKILEEISSKSNLTVINKKAAYKRSAKNDVLWNTDCRTTDIYNQIVYDKTGILLPSELRSNIRIL